MYYPTGGQGRRGKSRQIVRFGIGADDPWAGGEGTFDASKGNSGDGILTSLLAAPAKAIASIANAVAPGAPTTATASNGNTMIKPKSSPLIPVVVGVGAIGIVAMILSRK